MEVEFGDDRLRDLETQDGVDGRWGTSVIRGYRKVLRFIRAAQDERDFRAMRSLNFEQLKGNREGQHSLRVNQQFRLIIQIKEGNPKTIVVKEIVDYH